MIIFLYGPDTYRSRQKLNEIIENYKKAHQSGLNLRYFEGEDLNFEEIQNEIQQTSIIAGKKMLILKNVFSDIDFKEKFLKNSKNFISSKDLILFYEEREIPKTDSLLKFLKKSGKSQEFKLLEGQNLKNWIKKEIERYGEKADPEAVGKLAEFVGNDTWRLSNEIQKLASFKNGKDIQAKDVDLLVKPEIDNNIFRTIDAIAVKNKKKALELLHKHLEKGDPPLYLLNMINFQFRNLLMIKELIEKNQPYYSILRKTQLKPFVMGKSYQQAQRFSLPELKKIYQKLFKADINIKTGRIDPETVLDLLITEI